MKINVNNTFYPEFANNPTFTPFCQFIQKARDKKLINENERIVISKIPESLPPLEELELVILCCFLCTAFVLKRKEGGTFDPQTSFSLGELFEYILSSGKNELDVTLEDLELIGGLVHWILGPDYYKKAMDLLFGEDISAWLTPEMLPNINNNVNDADFRFTFKGIPYDQLFKFKTYVVDFIQNKHSRKKYFHDHELWNSIHKGALFNDALVPEEISPCYSIAIENANENIKYDLNFNLPIKRLYLFLRDALTISLIPLRPIIQALLQKKPIPEFPTIIPQSKTPDKGFQAIFDRCGHIVHIDDIASLDANAWAILMSLFSMAYRCPLDDADGILLKKLPSAGHIGEKFPSIVAHKLKKCLSNHHTSDPLILLPQFLNAVECMKKQMSWEEIEHVWEELQKPHKKDHPFQSFCQALLDVPTLQQRAITLIMQALHKASLPIEMLTACIQMAAFYALNESAEIDQQRPLQAFLIDKKGTVQVYLRENGKTYTLLFKNFNPLAAFKTFSKYEPSNEIQKKFLKSFIQRLCPIVIKSRISPVASFAQNLNLDPKAIAELATVTIQQTPFLSWRTLMACYRLTPHHPMWKDLTLPLNAIDDPNECKMIAEFRSALSNQPEMSLWMLNLLYDHSMISPHEALDDFQSLLKLAMDSRNAPSITPSLYFFLIKLINSDAPLKIKFSKNLKWLLNALTNQEKWHFLDLALNRQVLAQDDPAVLEFQTEKENSLIAAQIQDNIQEKVNAVLYQLNQSSLSIAEARQSAKLLIHLLDSSHMNNGHNPGWYAAQCIKIAMHPKVIEAFSSRPSEYCSMLLKCFHLDPRPQNPILGPLLNRVKELDKTDFLTFITELTALLEQWAIKPSEFTDELKNHLTQNNRKICQRLHEYCQNDALFKFISSQSWMQTLTPSLASVVFGAANVILKKQPNYFVQIEPLILLGLKNQWLPGNIKKSHPKYKIYYLALVSHFSQKIKHEKNKNYTQIIVALLKHVPPDLAKEKLHGLLDAYFSQVKDVHLNELSIKQNVHRFKMIVKLLPPSYVKDYAIHLINALFLEKNDQANIGWNYETVLEILRDASVIDSFSNDPSSYTTVLVDCYLRYPQHNLSCLQQVLMQTQHFSPESLCCFVYTLSNTLIKMQTNKEKPPAKIAKAITDNQLHICKMLMQMQHQQHEILKLFLTALDGMLEAPCEVGPKWFAGADEQTIIELYGYLSEVHKRWIPLALQLGSHKALLLATEQVKGKVKESESLVHLILKACCLPTYQNDEKLNEQIYDLEIPKFLAFSYSMAPTYQSLLNHPSHILNTLSSYIICNKLAISNATDSKENGQILTELTKLLVAKCREKKCGSMVLILFLILNLPNVQQVLTPLECQNLVPFIMPFILETKGWHNQKQKIQLLILGYFVKNLTLLKEEQKLPCIRLYLQHMIDFCCRYQLTFESYFNPLKDKLSTNKPSVNKPSVNSTLFQCQIAYLESLLKYESEHADADKLFRAFYQVITQIFTLNLDLRDVKPLATLMYEFIFLKKTSKLHFSIRDTSPLLLKQAADRFVFKDHLPEWFALKLYLEGKIESNLDTTKQYLSKFIDMSQKIVATEQLEIILHFAPSLSKKNPHLFLRQPHIMLQCHKILALGSVPLIALKSPGYQEPFSRNALYHQAVCQFVVDLTKYVRTQGSASLKQHQDNLFELYKIYFKFLNNLFLKYKDTEMASDLFSSQVTLWTKLREAGAFDNRGDKYLDLIELSIEQYLASYKQKVISDYVFSTLLKLIHAHIEGDPLKERRDRIFKKLYASRY